MNHFAKKVQQVSLYHQPQQGTTIREIPQNDPTFALFDPQIGGIS